MNKSTPTSKAQGILLGGKSGDIKERIKKFAMRFCLLVTPEAVPIILPTRPSKREKSKNDIHELVRFMGKAHEASALTKNYRQLRKSGSRRGGQTQEKRTNGFTPVSLLALKTYTQVTFS